MSVAGGQIITAADMNRALRGGPERPTCILRRTAALTVATGTQVLATWDVEDLDTHGWHSTSVNTSRITPNVAGYIDFTTQLTYGSVAGGPGRRTVQFRKNGVTTYWGALAAGLASANIAVHSSREIYCDGVSDYVEVYAFQDSGSSINTADLLNTYFSAKWLRE